MSVEIRGRLIVAPVPGDEFEQTVAIYRAPPKDRIPDPEHIAALAQDYERSGFDSVLVNQRSSYADPWVTSTWAAAATRTIKIAAAHRVGLQSPTYAARSLGALDRMSRGRAAIHIIQGSTDEDMQRDGDFLSKPERYRRAAEFLQILKSELTSEQPFNFEGQYYRVKDAWSAVKPVQQPYPVISAAGASEEGIEFCTSYADVYGMMGESLAGTTELVSRVRKTAAAKGRQLRFWRDCNFILARDDQAAWQKAEAIAEALSEGGAKYQMWEISQAGAKGEGVRPESVTHQRGLAAAPKNEKAQFNAANQAVRGGSGPAFVGSPQTCADAILEYYDLGVEVLTIGAPMVTQEDRDLLAELIDRIREGAAYRSQKAS